jgi:hypothetical protein
MAPAQLDRRMMSQMDLMAELTYCCVAWRLPLVLPFALSVFLGMGESGIAGFRVQSIEEAEDGTCLSASFGVFPVWD